MLWTGVCVVLWTGVCVVTYQGVCCVMDWCVCCVADIIVTMHHLFLTINMRRITIRSLFCSLHIYIYYVFLVAGFDPQIYQVL